MKREIKFRGKNRSDGSWVYGLLSYDSAGQIGLIDSCEGEKEYRYEVNHDTVGQYTGLKDKNGKEIYEGDILHYQGITSGGKKIIREVSFSETRSQFMFGFSPLYDFSIAPRIIVGNIYENPNLLNQS